MPGLGSANEAELFASIVHTPVATVITNPRLPDNPIVAANRAFCELTGYSEEEVVGRNCRFLGGGKDWTGSTVLREGIDQAKPVLTEVTNYRKNGTPFRNAVMIAPLFDENGTLAYFIGSQMDVTEGDGLPHQIRRTRAQGSVRGLTQRQRQVLEEMTLGYRNKQIAIRLGISEKTVKMHRASLLVKLGVPTSADAVRIAVEAGL